MKDTLLKRTLAASMMVFTLSMSTGCSAKDVIDIVKALDEVGEEKTTTQPVNDTGTQTGQGTATPTTNTTPPRQLAENQAELVPQLFSAVANNDLASVQSLYNAGVDLNQSATYDTESTNALNVASQLGFLPIVQFLVTNGANVSAVDENGNPPLMRAAMFGRLEVAKVLVANGASPNQGNSAGTTPLWWAVFSEEFEVVKFLVANGGDVNARTNEGKTILQSAVTSNSSKAQEISQFLIQNGATQ